jgi:hypothetical protein
MARHDGEGEHEHDGGGRSGIALPIFVYVLGGL